MKTVIPFKPRNDRDEQALFYHDKSFTFTKEIRMLPEYIGGVEKDIPVVEWEVFVVRMPKGIRKDLPFAVGRAIRSVGYYMWQTDGDADELLLMDNSLTSEVFVEMAKTGLFGYSERLSPRPSEGLYLPYYQHPHYLWQQSVSVVGVLLSIPQVSWLMHVERKKDRQEKAKRDSDKANGVNS